MEYDKIKHEKIKRYKAKHAKRETEYVSLCAYVRNAIDHPDQLGLPKEEEIVESLKLLWKIYKRLKDGE